MTRLLLAAALLLAGCNTGFEPQYRVRDLRVLAVRSGVPAGDSADVAPGDTLVLEALVANPLARPGLTVTWLGCLPQTSEAVSPCLDAALLADPRRLAGHPGVVPLGVSTFPAPGPDPAVVASVAVPLFDPVTVGSLTDALAFVLGIAKAQPVYECRLYAELPVVVVAEAGGRSSTAVKTVRVKPTAAQIAASGVTDYYTLNLNPRVGDVVRAPADASACIGGTPLEAAPFPGGRTTLCAQSASGSAGPFNVCELDGAGRLIEPPTSLLEALEWQWYVTDGDFPDDDGGIGNATGGDVTFDRPAGPFTLWAIVRDGRGGDDWASFAVSGL